MRFINPKVHGIIDWLFFVFLLLSPKLLEMEQKPANFTYALSIMYFVLIAATNYNAGIARVLPFFSHGVIELIIGTVLMIAGFSYFTHDPFGHPFFAWLGAFILVFWLFTNYETPKKIKARRRRAIS